MKKIIPLLFVIPALFSCSYLSSGSYTFKIHNPNNFDVLYLVNEIPAHSFSTPSGYYDEKLGDGLGKILKAHKNIEYATQINLYNPVSITIKYGASDPSDPDDYSGEVYEKKIDTQGDSYQKVELDFKEE